MTCMTSGRRRSGEAAASRLHTGPFLSSVSPAWKPLTPVQLFALVHWFSRVSACCVCVFNHCHTPPASRQLSFLAPKPTLTRKPMKTQTGLSISLPRSWTHPALKSSGLLEQVSRLHQANAVWLHHSSHASLWQSNIHTSYRDAAA